MVPPRQAPLDNPEDEWCHKEWSKELELVRPVSPLWVVVELEVDDGGGQEVEGGEVEEEVADQLLVPSLGVPLELFNVPELGCDLLQNVFGRGFA